MQSSFSDLKYAAKKKLRRRDRFLAGIHAATPWAALKAEIEPFYPKGEGRGRPQIGLLRMLRLYVAQQCFGVSDEAMKDTLYDSQAIRSFVGIDLSRESAPDATTLLKFRRLLETHGLTRKIFEAINGPLAEQGLILREGTIVDVTLIEAPPSTTNKAKARDPEMHQTKKGKNWHFGIKAHIGVDAKSRLTHTLITTAAKTSDISQTHALLHGRERTVFGDAGYQGVEKRPENQSKIVEWLVAMKRSVSKALPAGELGRLQDRFEKLKASIRAKVEHPFHVIKNLFRHRKTRYRGLVKNEVQLFSLFGFANLVLANRRMPAIHGQGAS